RPAKVASSPPPASGPLGRGGSNVGRAGMAGSGALNSESERRGMEGSCQYSLSIFPTLIIPPIRPPSSEVPGVGGAACRPAVSSAGGENGDDFLAGRAPPRYHPPSATAPARRRAAARERAAGEVGMARSRARTNPITGAPEHLEDCWDEPEATAVRPDFELLQ